MEIFLHVLHLLILFNIYCLYFVEGLVIIPKNSVLKRRWYDEKMDTFYADQISNDSLRSPLTGMYPSPIYPSQSKTIELNEQIPNTLISAHHPYFHEDLEYELIHNFEHEEVLDSQGILQEGLQEFTVETLVVVDSAFASQFNSKEDVTYYISVYWNAVAQRFASIEYPKISIELIGVYYLMQENDEKDVLSLNSNQQVDLYKTLGNFGRYVQIVKDLPDHDYAYLLTGRPSTSRKTGYSYVGGICGKSSSVGVGVDIGKTFESIGITVHEIGHSLGSLHDDNSNRCIASGNIMVPTPDIYRNPKTFYFSDCSVESMIKKFQAGSAKCLMKRSQTGSKFQTTSKLPGEITEAMNKRCQKYVVGAKATFVGQPDCTKMKCIPKGSRRARKHSILPLDGAPCGNGRRCDGSKCQ